jgi:hypothetical protein
LARLCHDEARRSACVPDCEWGPGRRRLLDNRGDSEPIYQPVLAQ